ncbi:MAG TPA: patatin-like phospholipase family protein, partial [Parvularculaceae bacterium]|nr:patatin-like phospholipase family protein [Parvularculaceae bacterium]
MARKLGLVLGSGAARGWAHVGVLRGLEEIGVKPDIIAGCSVGALVGGAYLIGALEEFEAWGRELSPLSAIGAFNFWVNRGGLVDAAPAFEAFAAFDRNIEDLPIKFGAVAADLGTGEEVWITQGSVIDAARASSAIPVLFHAVQRGPRWLVDGAVANPAPVSLARYLGADIVLSVDLNAIPRVLSRFNPPPPGVPALDPLAAFSSPDSFSGAVTKFIEDTRSRIERQMAIAKSRAQSKPQLFETAYAAVDIFQMHLTRLRAETSPPDIHLTPDMRDALPNS